MSEQGILELPILETKRLRLRKLKDTDVEDIFRYGSDEEVSRYVTWDRHQSIIDTKQYLEFAKGRYAEKQVAPWGIEWKETGRIVGTIDFIWWKPKHGSAEIGYVLSRDFWGKGIMTEAAKEVIRFGFEEMELIRIQARCLDENIGSSRVMEKAGMRFEGILRKAMFTKGKHWDIKIYSILQDEQK
ncbi:GNAT family N-acetyltransferase [Lederbergia galactosidilytica]|uniref:GCN5 family acetyltransferase n=1 Tax=Lederbergia galactosidilytica TaxID=217031 RepID=A0A178A1M9_9BACI|nr:GNAT family protein [Lederbergia galactosidilytica]KRG16146.1 GCN5 family acetyltransferase [Virgibacillus soli]MBP1914001.1 ribosomal-protein-alanine N-acetyltransferase [Lederbergia galactosidilytica]OAK74022.1 GCN5 family acetyltransferase [Lederbergia galactosidilytica]